MKTNLKNLIDIDMKYNFTPDTARLRYFSGGIPVFLWDEMADFGFMQSNFVSIDYTKEYASVNSSAYTKGTYIPWYNMSDDKYSHAAYCLEEYEDLALIDGPCYTMDEPKVIKGKFCYVSLRLLQELDMHYENNLKFQRTMVDVKTTQWSSQTKTCFTWMNTVEQLCDYDQETCNYVFRKEFDFTPFTEREDNKLNYYSMT